MDKDDLKDEIVEAIDEDVWDDLDEDCLDVTVDPVFRALLLSLWEGYAFFSGEVDEDRVEAMREALEEYAAREMPDEPEARQFVIQAMLARAFLHELPIHSPLKVRFHSIVKKGEEPRYFCPERDDSEDSICVFCCAASMDELDAAWEPRFAEAAEKEGPTTVRLMREAYRIGIQEMGVIPTGELVYHDKVREICEGKSCRHYNSSWACPPAVGTLEECEAQVSHFEKMLLLTKVYIQLDDMDYREQASIIKDFQIRMHEIGDAVKPGLKDCLILSTESCDLCETCTWPDAPCRYPDRLQPSLEGYGFMVKDLARQIGVPYTNGANSVSLYGAILYNEEQDE